MKRRALYSCLILCAACGRDAILVTSPDPDAPRSPPVSTTPPPSMPDPTSPADGGTIEAPPGDMPPTNTPAPDAGTVSTPVYDAGTTTPPAVACPDIQGAWTQVPTRQFPPYQGAPADADELAYMATKSPGPITWYAADVHWAQAYPYGVWPANEYVAPVEGPFMIVQQNVQMVLDSTTHGSGCHEGCQWIDNPTWEMHGDAQLLAIDTEGNLATLPSGNVFMLKLTFAAGVHGTLGIRAHVLSQNGSTYYTNELQFCLK